MTTELYEEPEEIEEFGIGGDEPYATSELFNAIWQTINAEMAKIHNSIQKASSDSEVDNGTANALIDAMSLVAYMGRLKTSDTANNSNSKVSTTEFVHSLIDTLAQATQDSLDLKATVSALSSEASARSAADTTLENNINGRMIGSNNLSEITNKLSALENIGIKIGLELSDSVNEQRFDFAVPYNTDCYGVFVQILNYGQSAILPVSAYDKDGFNIKRDANDSFSSTSFIYIAVGY